MLSSGSSAKVQANALAMGDGPELSLHDAAMAQANSAAMEGGPELSLKSPASEQPSTELSLTALMQSLAGD